MRDRIRWLAVCAGATGFLLCFFGFALWLDLGILYNAVCGATALGGLATTRHACRMAAREQLPQPSLRGIEFMRVNGAVKYILGTNPNGDALKYEVGRDEVTEIEESKPWRSDPAWCYVVRFENGESERHFVGDPGVYRVRYSNEPRAAVARHIERSADGE